jgi:hypothetical protein
MVEETDSVVGVEAIGTAGVAIMPDDWRNVLRRKTMQYAALVPGTGGQKLVSGKATIFQDQTRE